MAHVYVRTRFDSGAIVTSTATTQRQTLRGFTDLAPFDPSKITKRTVARWLKSIRHLAPGTRRNRYSVVRCFVRWLMSKGVLQRDPLSESDPPKVPRAVHRALTNPQADSLYRVCENPRDRLIVSFGLQLGLRRAEIAHLEVGSFSPDWEVVSVAGKGGHRRVLPVTLATRSDLLAYMAWIDVRAGHLIRGDRYPERQVRPEWVGRRVTRLAFMAGIKHRPGDGVSTHALRHHAATSVYQRTGDVLIVRDMLGHTSLAVTQVYVAGMDTAHMREAMEGRSYGPPRSASGGAA